MGVEQYSLVANDWLNLESIINDLTQRVVGQEVHPTSDPTFAGLTLDDLTASRLVATDASKILESVADLTSWIAGTFNQIAVADDSDGTITLSTPQDIHTGASPTFAGLTISTSGKINLRDVAIGIYSQADTFMDLFADGGIRIGDSSAGAPTNRTTFAPDGSISQAGTARIDWTKITANGVTLGDGPPTSTDSVSDLQTANDGNTYTVNEIAANAGQNLIVDFTGVTAFNWVQILGRYAGQGGHSLTIQLEITPFNDTAWHTFHTMIDQPANQNMQNFSFFVPDDSAYINSGTVKVRFIHEMAGNANDDWVFDVVALYQ